jgi:hypothetical protein
VKTSIMIVTCAVLLVRAEAGWALEPAAFRTSHPNILKTEPSGKSAKGNNPGLKSPSAAARLSLAGTIVPFWGGILLGKNEGPSSWIGGSLALGGILIGPSLGYFYGGRSRRAVSGIATRTGLLAIMGIAASVAEFPSPLGPGDEGNAAADITLLAFCGVGIATVFDLVGVPETVRRQNDRRLHEHPAVTPTVRLLNGSSTPGLGFTVTF